MTYTQAKQILGSRDVWELEHMQRALNMMQILNSPEENERLRAVRVMLKQLRKIKD